MTSERQTLECLIAIADSWSHKTNDDWWKTIKEAATERLGGKK